jgi:hypothetical protein
VSWRAFGEVDNTRLVEYETDDCYRTTFNIAHAVNALKWTASKWTNCTHALSNSWTRSVLCLTSSATEKQSRSWERQALRMVYDRQFEQYILDREIRIAKLSSSNRVSYAAVAGIGLWCTLLYNDMRHHSPVTADAIAFEMATLGAVPNRCSWRS